MGLTKVTYSMVDGPLSYLDDYPSLADALATGNAVMIPTGTTSITVDSADVAAVLAGLRQIRTDNDLVINLPAGEFTTTTIYSGAPNGSKITIRGATTLSKTISAASSSGSAGAYSVVFTVNDASGISTGDFVFIKSIVGTGREKVLEGCWEVTNVSGNNVTCLVKARKASLPALSVSSGTMLVAQTVIKVPDAIGIDVFGEGNIFQNMVLAGNGTGTGDISGVRITNGWAGFARSTAYPFGVVNFKEHGFYPVLGSIISCFDAYSCGNGQNGLYTLQASDAQATRLIATGNGTNGAVASTNSGLAASQGNFSGNGQRGLYVGQMGSATIASGYIYENVIPGVEASYRGFANVDSSKIAGNGTYGVRCQSNSYAYTVSVDYTGGNGSANELAQTNSIIQTTTSAQTWDAITTSLETGVATTTNHYTMTMTVANDAVGYIDFGATFKVRSIQFYTSTSSAHQGAVRVRTVSSLATTSIYGTGFDVNNYGTNPTGVLTGTTGTAGNMTISAANDGKVYFENRLGTTHTFVLDVMGT